MSAVLTKPEIHPDDLAVDLFAAAMKIKLAQARAAGRGGWDRPDLCTIADLSGDLRIHVGKGDPVDVANLAMMIWSRGANIVRDLPVMRNSLDFAELMRTIDIHQELRAERVAAERRHVNDRRRSERDDPGRRRSDRED